MTWDEWVMMGREDLTDHPTVVRIAGRLAFRHEVCEWAGFGCVTIPPKIACIIASHSLARSLSVCGTWNLKPITIAGGKKEIDEKVGVPTFAEAMIECGLGWMEKSAVVLFDQHHSFKHSFTDEKVRRYAKEKASRIAASRNNFLDGLTTPTKKITRGERGNDDGEGKGGQG